MAVKPFVALVTLAATALSGAGLAGADPPFVDHFKGRAAQAVLTDCLLENGMECMAVDVFVSEERYQQRGAKFPLEVVDVIVYDVVIDLSSEEGFIATPVAVGFSTDVEVSVAPNLSSASASANAIDLFPCEVTPDDEVICEEEPDGTMSLEVEWTATGKRQTSTFHARGTDGSLSFNFRAVDAFRAATATGDVDGEPLHETPLFPPSIFMTNNGVVERIFE
jgi:hypothetical protein